MPEMTKSWTAVVLTGGGSTRLGEDKAQAVLGTQSALGMILDQLPIDVPVIVVGPDPGNLPASVHIIREEPIGAGPAAAVAAALNGVGTEVLGLLATDMPFAVPVLADLLTYLHPDVDAVLAVDTSGRQQYLCAVYRVDALRTVMQGPMSNMAMRDIVAGLRVHVVHVEGEDALLDIDTPDDLQRARDLASSNQREGS
jgi:molybdenum cofactor guanylyltransferase